MTGRLPSDMLVGALLRRLNDAGGLGVVRARGDRQAGAILILIDDGERARFVERGISSDGCDALIESGPYDGDSSAREDYWRSRQRRDPDLWVIELNGAQAERFAAETILDD